MEGYLCGLSAQELVVKKSVEMGERIRCPWPLLLRENWKVPAAE